MKLGIPLHSSALRHTRDGLDGNSMRQTDGLIASVGVLRSSGKIVGLYFGAHRYRLTSLGTLRAGALTWREAK